MLSDVERRRRYDRGDVIDLSEFLGGFGGLDEVLRSVFGDGGLFGSRQQRRVRGRDILVIAEITLEMAAFGGDVPVEFDTRSLCGNCEGSGAEPGSDRATCPECGGSGQVRITQRSLFGTVMTSSTCSRCDGEGVIIQKACSVCAGTGSVEDKARVTVEVPAGVSTGTRLRLSGRGEAVGDRGPAGDLFVELTVVAHEDFERHDNDLSHQLRLGLAEATLGTRAKVPLIDGGAADLEIPPGTQPGELFRIRGEGMTVLGRRMRGDLIVIASVSAPDEPHPRRGGVDAQMGGAPGGEDRSPSPDAMKHVPHLVIGAPWERDSLSLSMVQWRHLNKVLRMNRGDEVTYTDGLGRFGSGRLGSQVIAAWRGARRPRADIDSRWR